MTEHFTRNTVSASAWCAKCKKFTPHRIDDRRKGPCLNCIAKLEAQHVVTKNQVIDIDELRRKLRVPQQREMFG
jgi:hypothetical protein